MSLAASNSYTGGTNISEGTLVFAAPGALPIRSPLWIGASATVIAANHGTGPKNTLFASSLTLVGTIDQWTGKIDLADNDMVVSNGILSVLNDQLKQGFNAAGGGNWNGSGGITSSAAAGDSRHPGEARHCHLADGNNLKFRIHRRDTDATLRYTAGLT